MEEANKEENKESKIKALNNIPNDNASDSSSMHKPEREHWGSRTEFFLASLGNMVGLGNIWRFPYLVFKNGGGAFVIPYVTTLVLIGIPLLLLETSIGQFTQMGPVNAYTNMSPFLQGVGYCAVFASFLISAYYNILISWTIFYTFDIFSQKWTKCGQDFNTDKCITVDEAIKINETTDRVSSTEEFFNRYMLNKSTSIREWSAPQPQLTTAMLVSTLIVVFCLCKGVKSSGKVVYFTATFPYFVLIILFFRGITLKGAMDGMKFYVWPDPAKVFQISVWRDALVQMFFSVSVGVGIMTTFGSYNRFHNQISRDITIITFGDLFTSLFSGLVIFSMLGFIANLLHKEVNETVSDGTGLAFIVILNGMTQMPLSGFWSFLFLLMLFFLGIDSLFAYVETVTSFYFDREIELGREPNKIKGTLFAGAILFIMGLPMTTRAGIYVFTLYDNFAAGIPIITACLFECIIISYIYGFDQYFADLSYMTGNDIHPKIQCLMKFSLSILTPIVLGIMFVSDFIRLVTSTIEGKFENIEFPAWSLIIGWLLAIGPISMIPLAMIYYVKKRPEKNLKDRIQSGLAPTEKYYEVAKKEKSFNEVFRKI